VQEGKIKLRKTHCPLGPSREEICETFNHHPSQSFLHAHVRIREERENVKQVRRQNRQKKAKENEELNELTMADDKREKETTVIPQYRPQMEKNIRALLNVKELFVQMV
jgi:hypothetical protein